MTLALAKRDAAPDAEVESSAEPAVDANALARLAAIRRLLEAAPRAVRLVRAVLGGAPP